jgi:hypothetical protein
MIEQQTRNARPDGSHPNDSNPCFLHHSLLHQPIEIAGNRPEATECRATAFSRNPRLAQFPTDHPSESAKKEKLG